MRVLFWQALLVQQRCEAIAQMAAAKDQMIEVTHAKVSNRTSITKLRFTTEKAMKALEFARAHGTDDSPEAEATRKHLARVTEISVARQLLVRALEKAEAADSSLTIDELTNELEEILSAYHHAVSVHVEDAPEAEKLNLLIPKVTEMHDARVDMVQRNHEGWKCADMNIDELTELKRQMDAASERAEAAKVGDSSEGLLLVAKTGMISAIVSASAVGSDSSTTALHNEECKMTKALEAATLVMNVYNAPEAAVLQKRLFEVKSMVDAKEVLITTTSFAESIAATTTVTRLRAGIVRIKKALAGAVEVGAHTTDEADKLRKVRVQVEHLLAAKEQMNAACAISVGALRSIAHMTVAQYRSDAVRMEETLVTACEKADVKDSPEYSKLKSRAVECETMAAAKEALQAAKGIAYDENAPIEKLLEIASELETALETAVAAGIAETPEVDQVEALWDSIEDLIEGKNRASEDTLGETELPGRRGVSTRAAHRRASLEKVDAARAGNLSKSTRTKLGNRRDPHSA
jgi:hypothetical protein